jgi:isopentenyl diphosphate isomerase/L-lactate dehydrogenase-like FMN-dependent dehydrogenase
MGQEGVEGVLDILIEELEQTMAVAGCPNIAAITSNHVTHI